MTEAGAPPGGLFGAFVPFDERSAETFFGRTEETALLDQLLAGEARVVTFMGASGVGKTSLLRAGLTPALARRGVAAVTLGSYRDLDRELVRETSRLGIARPVPGQDPADYLGGVAREAKGGLVLILDHLEEALGPARRRRVRRHRALRRRSSTKAARSCGWCCRSTRRRSRASRR